MSANMTVTATFQDLGLIGTWIFSCSDGSCVETFIFNSDGTYTDIDAPTGSTACTMNGTYSAFGGVLTLTAVSWNSACGTVTSPFAQAYSIAGNILNTQGLAYVKQ